jgi:hypothetical protein
MESIKIESTIGKYVQRGSKTGLLNWFRFRAYDLFADRVDSNIIQIALQDLVRPIANQIDIFIPIVSSGISISIMLHTAFDIPVIFLHETDASTQSILFSKLPQPRICLVDTNINTRGTFYRSVSDLIRLNFMPDRFVSILYNDLWPQDNEILAKLRKDGKLQILCTTSRLVSLGLVGTQHT